VKTCYPCGINSVETAAIEALTMEIAAVDTTYKFKTCIN
jgi:hypothetical protein